MDLFPPIDIPFVFIYSNCDGTISSTYLLLPPRGCCRCGPPEGTYGIPAPSLPMQIAFSPLRIAVGLALIRCVIFVAVGLDGVLFFYEPTYDIAAEHCGRVSGVRNWPGGCGPRPIIPFPMSIGVAFVCGGRWRYSRKAIGIF